MNGRDPAAELCGGGALQRRSSAARCAAVSLASACLSSAQLVCLLLLLSHSSLSSVTSLSPDKPKVFFPVCQKSFLKKSQVARMLNGSDAKFVEGSAKPSARSRDIAAATAPKVGTLSNFFVCLFVLLYFLWAIKFNVAFDTWLPDRFFKKIWKKDRISSRPLRPSVLTANWIPFSKSGPRTSASSANQHAAACQLTLGPVSPAAAAVDPAQALCLVLFPRQEQDQQTSRCDRFPVFVLILCLKMRPCNFWGTLKLPFPLSVLFHRRVAYRVLHSLPLTERPQLAGLGIT